ncbi:hypothetical protein LCGC14_1693240 [marine sediment metagenome]|uniref:Uncharacterized protein n=1 Tax=marine sediment metagenome TaxID=412755 RepID=A0A0F9HKP3_9ZZZZ
MGFIKRILNKSSKKHQQDIGRSKKTREIEFIKQEAFMVLMNKPNLLGIQKASELIKEANTILSSYNKWRGWSTRKYVNFDRIYRKMAEISISDGDLPSALKYNDKIEDRAIKSNILIKIDKRETEINNERCENCNDAFNGILPQIDGEAFRLCSTCFNILNGLVQDINNIFDDN